MAWVDDTFVVGQVLTAARMEQLQGNFTALAQADSGSPLITSSAYAPSINAGYDIRLAIYAGKSFSVAAQDTAPRDVAFSDDGLKLFMLGGTNDALFQYVLADSYSIDTASYTSIVFSLSNEDTEPRAVQFRADGNKFFVLGDTNDQIYAYSVGSPWDISSVTFDSVVCSLAAEDTSVRGFCFNNDGLKLYTVGTTSDYVYEYHLTASWDLSTGSYSGVKFSVAGEDGTPEGVSFSSGGDKLFVLGGATDAVYQYAVGSAFDVSSAYYLDSFSITSQEGTPLGFTFGSDGRRAYVIGSGNDTVYQYSTPWFPYFG